MKTKQPARVLGPYQEGQKWRVIIISAEGRRSRIFRSEAEARELKALSARSPKPQVSQLPRTLTVALHEYEYNLRDQRSRQSWTHTLSILRAFLPEPSAPLTAVTPRIARQLAHFEHPGVRRIRRSYAASTRRAVLGHVRRFYDWALKMRYVKINPFAGVEPVGIVGTAMRRLYPDEVPRFTRVALSAVESGDVAALGALLLVVMKLQSGQVRGLRVADVDLDGQRLQVTDGHGTAWRIIPQELLPAVRRAVETRQPSDLVLGASRTGGVRPRNFLWRTVQRLWTKAPSDEVPQNSPHVGESREIASLLRKSMAALTATRRSPERLPKNTTS